MSTEAAPDLTVYRRGPTRRRRAGRVHAFEPPYAVARCGQAYDSGMTTLHGFEADVEVIEHYDVCSQCFAFALGRRR